MFVFKKQIFGFMDLLRFKKMVPKRREALAEGAATPLPKRYRVNETAAVLHPGYQKATLTEVREVAPAFKSFTFALEKPMHFRAGQYVTLGCRVGESEVARPYAVSSAPKAALAKMLTLTVKKEGFFSGYLVDEAKAGDVFTIGDPSGEFFYEPLRDAKTVVALAGGSGITPFYSLAQAIADGTEDCSLVLFYGARTEKDLAFKAELDALAGDKIKVIYVLSDEEREGYEHGFITAELIKAHASGDYTVMICGPGAMLRHLDGELKKLALPRRRIRMEANCTGTRDVAAKTYTITVHLGFETYSVSADSRETILTALERAGLKVPSKCRGGVCGFCHSRLISGDHSVAGEDARRLADHKFGYIHPCCTYPDSDMEIDVPPQA